MHQFLKKWRIFDKSFYLFRGLDSNVHGHLNVIRRAKEQCDFLIVGISTDELVQKTKNKTPVIPFEDRCKNITALKYVDKVVPQENKDKIAAFYKYKFDAMFVGDGWKGSELFSKCEAELKKIWRRCCVFSIRKKGFVNKTSSIFKIR